MDEDYATFRDDLMGRHQNALTSNLSTLGDVLLLAGVAAAVITRKPKWLAAGFVSGFVAAAGAHLFQSGTLGPELRAVGRHPVWATRAEAERIRGRSSV